MNQTKPFIIFPLIITIYVALITFQPSLQLWPKNIVWFIDRQRILELILLFLVLLDAFTIKWSSRDYIKLSKPIKLATLVLMVLAFFSISLAYIPRHAMVELSVCTALIYFSLLIASIYPSYKKILINYLSYIIWASVLLYMFSFYTGYVTATIVKKPLTWPFPFTGFTNIRSFNQYQLWTLGFILLPLLSLELNKVTRILLNIGITGWWVLLFYSASRGVLIAWVIGLCMTAFFYKKLSWPFLKLQISHLVTGFISYQLLFKLIPKTHGTQLITHTVVRQTTNDRLVLWDQAILMIKNYPIFGVGPMHYAWFNKTNGHPHNGILQLTAEWGLPATLIILAICVYAFFCWYKKFSINQLITKSILDKNLSIILFFTIITNAAYSMVDGVIVMPISQVLMFTMIGLMLGQYISSENLKLSYKPRFRPWIAGFLLIVMAWSTYPELKQGFSGDKKGFSLGHTAIGPRFWRETK